MNLHRSFASAIQEKYKGETILFIQFLVKILKEDLRFREDSVSSICWETFSTNVTQDCMSLLLHPKEKQATLNKGLLKRDVFIWTCFSNNLSDAHIFMSRMSWSSSSDLTWMLRGPLLSSQNLTTRNILKRLHHSTACWEILLIQICYHWVSKLTNFVLSASEMLHLWKNLKNRLTKMKWTSIVDGVVIQSLTSFSMTMKRMSYLTTC